MVTFARSASVLAAGAAGIVVATISTLALAQEPFIGEIRMLGFNFCPRGWAPAAGQLLPINQNQALFALLGTTYGGDGRNTFALPDLRGRVPVADGHGSGLSNVRLGEQGGQEHARLTTDQLPAHSHSASTAVTIHASDARAETMRPGGRLIARSRASNGRAYTYRDGPADVTLADTAATAETTIGPAGGNLPVGVRDPFLGLRFCIALVGVFPARQ